MNAEKVRLIWSEIQTAETAASESQQTAFIDEKVEELWRARFISEDTHLTEASMEATSARLAAAMRDRQARKSGWTVAVAEWLRGSRRLTAAMLALAVVLAAGTWYAIYLARPDSVVHPIAAGNKAPRGSIEPHRPLPSNPQPHAGATGGAKRDTPNLAGPAQRGPSGEKEIPRGEGLVARKAEVGKISTVMGEPTITIPGDRQGRRALPNMAVTTAMRIETGDADKVTLTFKDGTTLALGFNTSLEIPAPVASPGARPPMVVLNAGDVAASVTHAARQTQFAIATPTATAEVVGTKFDLSVHHSIAQHRLETGLRVFEGTVRFFNDRGTVLGTAMTQSTAALDSRPTEPRRLLVLRRKADLVILTRRFTAREAVDHLVLPLSQVGWTIVEENSDLVVRTVDEHSPAQSGGVRDGDAILTLDGHITRNMSDFLRIASRANPAMFTVSVRRGVMVHALRITSGDDYRSAAAGSPTYSNRLWSATLPAIEGRADEAVRALSRVAGTVATAAVYNNLGVVHEMRDEVGQAIRCYQTAIRLSPGSALYHFNLGSALQSIGNPHRASEELAIATRLAPNHAGFASNLAFSLVLDGRKEEALAIAERAAKQFPQSALTWSVLASLRVSSGQFEAGLKDAGNAVRLRPSDGDAWSLLARAALKLGKFEEAERALRVAIGINPREALLYLNLGNVLSARGKFRDAVAATRQAIQLEPKNSDAYMNLGVQLQDLGENAEAEEVLRKAVALDSKNGPAHTSLAKLLLNSGRVLEAESDFRTSISLDPQDFDAHNALGVILLNTGRASEAEAMFKKAIDLTPVGQPPLAHINLSRILLDAGRYEEAEAILRKGAQTAAPHPMLLTNLAATLMRLGRNDEAEPILRKAILLDPNGWRGHVNLAFIFEQRGNFDKAEEQWREALRVGPTSENVVNGLADYLLRRKRIGDAEEVYRGWTKLEPTNPNALNALAWFLADHDLKAAEAVEWARKAVSLSHGNPDTKDTLGWALFRTGQFDEAATVLRSASETSPDMPGSADIWFHLGSALEAKGDKTGALEAFEHALKLDSSHVGAKNGVTRIKK